MKEISVFDVIGPNMIGPSSSHTAGALRLSRMVWKMLDAPLRRVSFTLFGSFARTHEGHGTDRALLGGMLGFEAEDRRIRYSFEYAWEQGIDYTFETDEGPRDLHPNTVRIVAEDKNGQILDVWGESVGGGAARLTRINDVEVDITGELTTIVIMQHDEPGVIAHLTRVLYDEKINIAFLNVYRENRNETAFSVIEVDGEIHENVLHKLQEVKAVQKVSLLAK